MREDDYTGSLIGDDDEDSLVAADADLYEFDVDDERLADEFAALAENEQVLNFGDIANGAKSLRDAAEALHDFADDLVTLSEEGWELVDDVQNSYGTAVQFAALEEETP